MYDTTSSGRNRRLSWRVSVDMFLNQYVGERPFRAFAMNVSPQGLFVQKLIEPGLQRFRRMSLEFELPGTGETIWAAAEPRFDSLDSAFHTSGLLFTAMARKHERLLLDFVREKVISPGFSSVRSRLGRPSIRNGAGRGSFF